MLHIEFAGQYLRHTKGRYAPQIMLSTELKGGHCPNDTYIIPHI